MRRSVAVAAWSVSIAAAVLPPAPVCADDAEAKRLFDAARALADRGKFVEACALFQESYERERAPGTMLNLADCAERDGKLRRAWLLYDAAAKAFDEAKSPGRARYARGRADALAPRLATVVVRLAEPRVVGLTVRIGDRAVPPAGAIVERLDPGEVPIVVAAPGRTPFATTATAVSGDEVTVAVPPLRVERGPGVPVPRPPERARRRRSRVLLAGGLAGGGVVALGVAGGLAWSARSLYRDQLEAEGSEPPRCVDAGDVLTCSPEGRAAVDRAGRRADYATFAAIGGGALVAAGAILFFTAPRERTAVTPIAAPGALGIAVAGRF